MEPHVVDRELSYFEEALPDWGEGEFFCVKNYSGRDHEYGFIAKSGDQWVPTVYDGAFSHPRTFSTLRDMVEAGWIAD